MNGKKGNVSHRCYAQLRAGEGDLEYILSIDNPSDIFWATLRIPTDQADLDLRQ